MWVITRAINDYSQYGDYLECVYDHKPSIEELTLFFGDVSIAIHVHGGGGRIKEEDSWWYLTELQNGQQYIEK